MIKYLFLLLLGTTSGDLGYPTADEMVGTWKVVQVVIDPASPMATNKEVLDQAKVMMSKMVFSIKANHQFTMSGITGQQMPPGTWQYDPSSHILKVTEKGQGNSRLAVIMVSKNAKGEVFFKMQETPVTLKVKK